LLIDPSFDRAELIRLAAAAEHPSEHPLARAVVQYAGSTPLPTASSFRAQRGRGIDAEIEGHQIRIGSMDFLLENNLDLDSLHRRINSLPPTAATHLYVAIDGRPAGVFLVSDQPRPEAPFVVQQLRRQGRGLALLTGDASLAAELLARNLGIDRIAAGLSPEAKADQIERWKTPSGKNTRRTHIAFVGDGLNDAPALAAADLGIAIGSGTDLAKASADIVATSSDLHAVPRALTLGRIANQAIRQNLFWAMAYNALGIPLAAVGAFGKHGPLIASLAMAASSLTVVIRSSLVTRARLDPSTGV
jgi:Cu+-exporting ATPase